MIVKENFDLLKNTQNVLNISEATIRSQSIENGPRQIFASLELAKMRINHFSKKRVFDIISNVRERESIHLVNFDKYILPVGYNKPTKGIVINLSYFGTNDISKVDSRNIYACLVYGICLRDLIHGKVPIKETYATSIVNFLTSVFVRIFGKEFGLLGPYSAEITKMKFLLACYILTSFMGIKGTNLFRYASSISPFKYKEIEDDLRKVDFSNIENFIKSLSVFKAMPGLEKYQFTSKILRFLGVNFIPALEDLSRFISTLIVIDVKGSTIVPGFAKHYNEYEFNKILTVSKSIFR